MDYTILSTFLVYFGALAQAQINRCQTSSDGTFLYPNIDENDLSPTGINSNLYMMLWNWETRLYTIPAYSATGRNCYGEVSSFRYCYWIRKQHLNINLTAFEVVFGNHNSTTSRFHVARVISAYSIPTLDKCSPLIDNWWRLCCDDYSESNGHLFQIAKSQYMFGINILWGVQGVLKNTYKMLYYSIGGRADVQSILSLQFKSPQRKPFLLLQFTIVPTIELTTTPMMEMSTPTTPLTTIAQSTASTGLSTTSFPPTSDIPPHLSFTSRRPHHPLPTSTDAQYASTITDTTQLLLTSTKYRQTSEPPLDSLSSSDATQPSDAPANNNEEVKDAVARGGVSPAIIGGAVAGLLMLLLLIVVVGVALIAIWLKRRTKRTANEVESLREFNNTVYGEGLVYANMGPDAISTKSKEAKTKVKGSEYSYAEAGASQGVIYEEPTELGKSYEAAEYHTLEEEDIYMEPPCNEDALYSQLEGITQECPREKLSLGTSLGSGQFGMVHRGVWRCGQKEVQVAIKTLREGSTEEDKVKFLQEAAIMGQFKHSNVVRMYGVVKEGEPILLVMELLTKGDLRGHLLNAKAGDDVIMDDHTLLSYCRQIVSGMLYLSNKKFVHRDLAARNILVTEEEICKIADFGMSRDLMYDGFYVSHGGLIPVKWTAPEALYYKTYSTASDVWSFGVLMYEVWSVGHKPFETMDNNKVLHTISSGVRLAPPPGCPRKIYSIMIDCWHPESCKRPSFLDLRNQLFLSDSKLLAWTEEDKSTHPEAGRLGAALDCSQDLHKSLQIKYVKK